MANNFFKLSNRKMLFILSFAYFITRLINLTKLPIFNDEAIYLDWGWREITQPGNLYFSLYDNKQPFLMWIFGISQSIFSDPLFAGRIVSVLTGFGTFLGIYFLSKKLFNDKVAILASLLYLIVPIFVFYDRQALMESTVGTVGVWSTYLFIGLFETNKRKFAVLLGIVLGLGFFIKSSALLFPAAFTLISLVLFFRGSNRKILKSLPVVFAVMFAVNLLLLINPQFWSTLGKNRLYTLSIGEIFHFPFAIWFSNFLSNLQILFFFLTPFVFATALGGIVIVLKSNDQRRRILTTFLLLTIILQTLIARDTTQRYLVSFIPLFVIFSAYFILSIRTKALILMLLSITVIIPAALSLFLIFKPADYILVMSRVSSVSETVYVEGMTSGYGIPETVSFFKSLPKTKQIFVGVALNAGNPENAILVYLARENNIRSGYLDSKLFTETLNDTDCLKSDEDIYFVSRFNQQAGLEKFLHKIKTFKKPYDDSSIGIYEISQNCRGKTIDLNLTRQ